MEKNNIDLPFSIQEFYVNNNNDKFYRTLKNNKEEYDRIKKQKNQSVFNSDFLLNQFAERKSLYDYISIEKDDNNDFIF